MSNLASMTVCSPRQIVPHIIRAIKATLVPIVRSSPGVGKSDIARQIARQYNLKMIDMRLAQLDPTDLNGLPRFTEDGFAIYAPFVDFPLEGSDPGINPETGEAYAGWMIFFDEITSAPKQIQAAAYKIILDRMIGQKKLDRRVVMMAAGNLETDNAVVHSMSTALQSRLIHLDLEVSDKDWINWAVNNGIDSRVIGFISFQPKMLYQFKPDSQDHTYPCPRTWEFTSRLIINHPTLGHEDLPVIAGAISPGPATQFIEFCRIYETLPKISAIIANPGGIFIPQEPGIKYAIATMLVEHFDQSNAKELTEFLARLPVESQVICLRLIAARNTAVLSHPDVAKLFGKLGRLMAV